MRVEELICGLIYVLPYKAGCNLFSCVTNKLLHIWLRPWLTHFLSKCFYEQPFYEQAEHTIKIQLFTDYIEKSCSSRWVTSAWMDSSFCSYTSMTPLPFHVVTVYLLTLTRQSRTSMPCPLWVLCSFLHRVNMEGLGDPNTASMREVVLFFLQSSRYNQSENEVI